MIQPEDCAEVVRMCLRLSPRARIPQVVIERLGASPAASARGRPASAGSARARRGRARPERTKPTIGDRVVHAGHQRRGDEQRGDDHRRADPVRDSSARGARARRGRSAGCRPSACPSRGASASWPTRRGRRAAVRAACSRARAAVQARACRPASCSHRPIPSSSSSSIGSSCRIEAARDRIGLRERLADEREARRQGDAVLGARFAAGRRAPRPSRMPESGRQ